MITPIVITPLTAELKTVPTTTQAVFHAMWPITTAPKYLVDAALSDLRGWKSTAKCDQYDHEHRGPTAAMSTMTL